MFLNHRRGNRDTAAGRLHHGGNGSDLRPAHRRGEGQVSGSGPPTTERCHKEVQRHHRRLQDHSQGRGH